MWQAASLADLGELVRESEGQMEPSVRAFWDRIRITPHKWQLSPLGDEGGGFWVVSLLGRECIYFDDIEDRFSLSHFETVGVITERGWSEEMLVYCVRSCHKSFAQALASAV